MNNLKSSIIGSCELCGKTGFLPDNSPCKCLLKFRAFNRLILGGFTMKSLELVSSDFYELPIIESGEEFLDYYSINFDEIENRGLSLYIHSRERGRGKTTLTHYLVYKAALYFSHKDKYSTSRDYTFINIEDLLEFDKNGKADYWKSTWLVIDDLGNENRSAVWKKENVSSLMQKLMHYRRDRNLPTLITSNYKPDNLSVLYSGDLDSLLEIGPDGSIRGMVFREVEVGGGEDFRQVTDFTSWPV